MISYRSIIPSIILKNNNALDLDVEVNVKSKPEGEERARISVGSASE
jgi:hypothetical protein